MMDFKEFKELLTISLRSYLTPHYGEVELTERLTHKNNCTLTGITIDMKDIPDNISPTFYLEPLYEQYQSGYEFDEVMEVLEMQIKNSIGEKEIIKEQLNMLKEAKDKICFQLVHTEQNKEFLKEHPHRDFMNLSVVYRAVLAQNESGMASALITNQLADYYGLDEQQLYELAYENTKRMLQPEAKPLGQMVKELLQENQGEVPNELTEENSMPFFVVSNNCRERGAISVIYPEVMQSIVEQVDSDLYLLPSSVHEMLVVPANRITYEELAEMLHEVNPTVDVEDRLSNDIYKYDRASQSFEQVTDYSDMSLADMAQNEGMEMSM